MPLYSECWELEETFAVIGTTGYGAFDAATLLVRQAPANRESVRVAYGIPHGSMNSIMTAP